MLVGAVAALALLVPSAAADETVVVERDLRWSRHLLDAGPRPIVPGGSMTATATAGGVHYEVVTNGLEPGRSYTMWFEFANHPEHCVAPPGDGFRCGAVDFVANPLADASIVYGTGIASATGTNDVFEAELAASSLPSDLHGLAAYGLQRVLAETSPVRSPLREKSVLGLGLLSNPLGAEYQVIIVDHGPYDPDRFGDDQWTSHMGGCHIEDGFPWPFVSGVCGPEQGAGWAVHLPWPGYVDLPTL